MTQTQLSPLEISDIPSLLKESKDTANKQIISILEESSFQQKSDFVISLTLEQIDSLLSLLEQKHKVDELFLLESIIALLWSNKVQTQVLHYTLWCSYHERQEYEEARNHFNAAVIWPNKETTASAEHFLNRISDFI